MEVTITGLRLEYNQVKIGRIPTPINAHRFLAALTVEGSVGLPLLGVFPLSSLPPDELKLTPEETERLQMLVRDIERRIGTSIEERLKASLKIPDTSRLL